MSILGTIIFYLALCVLLVFLAWKVDTGTYKGWFVFSIILILTLVAGLRHETVGVDTAGYVDHLFTLQDGYVAKLNNISEQGFIFLSYLLATASSGYTLALLVYALITNGLIILRLYDYKDKISFTWAVFIYYMAFYFATFNTMRQWIAMALVFFATRYIGKSLIKFLIFVAMAVLTHTTAIFAVFFVPLYYLLLPSKSVKEIIRKIVMILAVVVAVLAVYTTMTSKYSDYILSDINGDVSWVNIMLVLFMLFILIYERDGKLTFKVGGPPEENVQMGMKLELVIFFIAMGLTLLVFVTRYADRIGQYFMLFEMVCLPYYIKKEKTRYIALAFTILLCLYLRIPSWMASGYGEVPYLPFWI